MICNCLGYKRVDFVNDTRERVSGYKIFISYEETDVTGVSCDSLFFSDESMRSMGITFQPGSQYDIEFTRRGRVSSISLA